ncbi:hypothetical protein [Leptospira santarosai]|uniref:Uncharacterized protein n=1 Tax=Leptospira santarosai serovar Shermani str. LT 821 TaxID=758847 RepID=A0A097ET32_9LEPT|nr:hypothetical protein [Leptospira santarosai]AIT11119.1 hypothetical protein LSS_23250 [Leptospira santarosai serovar Shermani str. LT 821]
MSNKLADEIEDFVKSEFRLFPGVTVQINLIKQNFADVGLAELNNACLHLLDSGRLGGYDSHGGGIRTCRGLNPYQ